MVSFATAYCVMGKLVLRWVRNSSLEWSRPVTKSSLPWAIAGDIHIDNEEKKLREKQKSEWGPREAFRISGQASEWNFWRKKKDARVDILVNLKSYKEKKAENHKAGEAESL